ncbi:MAG: glycosyltransferase [Phycisphaerales bacterium]
MVHGAEATSVGTVTALDAGHGAGVAPGPSGPKRLRVAIAHDWLCGYRGGEGVLERLIQVVQAEHDLAGLFVMFDDQRPLRPAIDTAPKFISRVGRWPAASTTRLRQYLMPMYPRAVRQLTQALEDVHARKPVDLLITSSSAAVKNMRPPHAVPHLCYCHSPPRYVWAQAAEYRRDRSLRSLGLKFYGTNYQRWDRVGSSPDYITRLLANSTYTAEQIAQCYERSARVIYPPVRTDYFTPAMERVGQSRSDTWLYVGALEPYKRVDLAVQAANKLNQELLIIGRGTEGRALRRAAGPKVRFLGYVSDEELREHYRRARLLIFPQVEDFGIVAVEAQACGLPVVARNAGGAADTVLDGVTGALFDEPTMEHLIAATIRCPRRCDSACRVNAERFGERVFDSAIAREIEELCGVGR